MLYIDKKSKTPLYEQLYNSLTNEILSGGLLAGDCLPATRKLSLELSIGRNTVNKAYQQLVAEGYVQAKMGSGFIVNKLPLELFPKKTNYAEDLSKEDSPSSRIDYDFAYGSMDNSLFPYGQWRKSMNNALSLLEFKESMSYPDKKGEPALRQEIARYLKRSRGVSCHPSQIVITCGQQHSMEIIANIFEYARSSGKVFAMEEPGYDGIRAVFINRNYKTIHVPVEKDGISYEKLEPLDIDLLYLTPSHQFPSGAVLSIAKRQKLIQWAENTDTYLIEDDYDSELRYYTNPVPSMQSLDNYGRTIYTGTFSKALAPYMRIAYIVFPSALMEDYTHYYHRYHSHVTPFHQLALADFIRAGSYERHINRLKTIYRKKHSALVSTINRVFGNKISIKGGGCGIHLLLNVKANLCQEELIERAEKSGIRVYPTRPLYADASACPENEILIGFPTIDENKFDEIFSTLYRVWFS